MSEMPGRYLAIDEWIDRAFRSYEPVEALLAIASAVQGQTAYCSLPPGYRAVFANDDGELFVEPIVAIASHGERRHEPVTCSTHEGFIVEGEPIWYLRPGESLEAAEHSIREVLAERQAREARLAERRGETGP